MQRVRRAVDGLGDLMDDYEFHYPQELSEDNLEEVREVRSTGTASTASRPGLHLDPMFGRGGLCSPDSEFGPRRSGARSRRPTSPGELGANFIIWPGIEGYNYPFQTPYAESWAWFLEGIGLAAEKCREHGVLLFLEHKNSEPAMKILMRNIGMTLHVIHKLREGGLHNVKVNMDWQHLLMNGESLGGVRGPAGRRGPARPPARELGLGHVRRRQHGRRDGVHGDARARARAAPLRLWAERRAPRLRPLSVYGGRGRRRAPERAPVAVHRVGRGAGSTTRRSRQAQMEKDAVRAYELVYAALGA